MNCKHCAKLIVELHKVTDTPGLNGSYCSANCIGLRAGQLLPHPKPLAEYPLGMTASELRELLNHYADCEEVMIALNSTECTRITKVVYTPHGLVLFPDEKYLQKSV